MKEIADVLAIANGPAAARLTAQRAFLQTPSGKRKSKPDTLLRNDDLSWLDR